MYYITEIHCIIFMALKILFIKKNLSRCGALQHVLFFFFIFFFNITKNYLKLENLCHFEFSYLHNFIAQKKETKKKEEEN